MGVIFPKYVHIKSILHHVLTAFVLRVVLGYPWPSSPPLPRIIEDCLYLQISYVADMIPLPQNLSFETKFCFRHFVMQEVWTQKQTL
jgi:hypothetical protein